MLKNIILVLLALFLLDTAYVSVAADDMAAKMVAAETMPAETMSAESMPAEMPAQDAEMGTATKVIKQPSINMQPLNDSHVDYRYCLELKTDREIAECRYKK